MIETKKKFANTQTYWINADFIDEIAMRKQYKYLYYKPYDVYKY